MNIQLKGWQVENLELTTDNNNSKKKEGSFGLETGVYFPKDSNAKDFRITFDVDLIDEDLCLYIKAYFNFELDESITDNFKKSSFPKINAPAIAFPYLRAFISNLTLQSGFSPMILPSINFVNLAKEKDNK